MTTEEYKSAEQQDSQQRTARQSLISFSDAIFSYSEEGPIVLNISKLEVVEGKITALVGPSGCGKTTLLQLMLKRLHPRSGSCTYTFDPDHPGIFGYVSQSNSLIPWLTVFGNVEYPLLHLRRDLSRDGRRGLSIECLKAVGLDNATGKYPKQLSGGMARRVMLARSLVYSPKVVLLDEPFSGLDLYTKDTLIELLISLYHKYKRTIVWVTHDIQDVVLMSHFIYLFDLSNKFDPEPIHQNELLGASQRFAANTRYQGLRILKKAGNLYDKPNNQ
jgi:NitT/TauT family transport system ATP-binding protein